MTFRSTQERRWKVLFWPMSTGIAVCKDYVACIFGWLRVYETRLFTPARFQFVGLESSLLLLLLWDISAALQDPKSSLWLWKKHERKKQKKRTVNYQHYLEMMRTDGNFLSTSGDEGDDGYGHMTKKYMAKIENFLTFGQRNLDRRQIEKLKKENERKERVSTKTFPI